MGHHQAPHCAQRNERPQQALRASGTSPGSRRGSGTAPAPASGKVTGSVQGLSQDSRAQREGGSGQVSRRALPGPRGTRQLWPKLCHGELAWQRAAARVSVVLDTLM